MTKKHFCTCQDTKCNFHPGNHDKGCDLCIQKCLKTKEIPACFFRDIFNDLSDVNDFTYEGFCNFLNQHRSGK